MNTHDENKIALLKAFHEYLVDAGVATEGINTREMAVEFLNDLCLLEEAHGPMVTP